MARTRAANAAARLVCVLRKDSQSDTEITTELAPSLYGNHAEAAAFVAASIRQYCPQRG
jgi:hypothetical protein